MSQREEDRGSTNYLTMQKLFVKCPLAFIGLFVTLSLFMQSCGGSKSLIVPHSISTASAVKVSDLDLKAGQYEILQTIVETASITCEYKDKEIKIVGDDFSYRFEFNEKKGWSLKSFSGAASLGYFLTDVTNENTLDNTPRPEEFSRRVAMARIINAASDFGADGIIEPITTTVSSDAGKRKVEFTSTVRAKLISIKKTR